MHNIYTAPFFQILAWTFSGGMYYTENSGCSLAIIVFMIYFYMLFLKMNTSLYFKFVIRIRNEKSYLSKGVPIPQPMVHYQAMAYLELSRMSGWSECVCAQLNLHVCQPHLAQPNSPSQVAKPQRLENAILVYK